MKLFVVQLSGRYATGMHLVSARDEEDARKLVNETITEHNPLRITSVYKVKATTSEKRGRVACCEYIE